MAPSLGTSGASMMPMRPYAAAPTERRCGFSQYCAAADQVTSSST